MRTSAPAAAQTVTGNDILYFGFNLECPKGQYYTRGFFGAGLLPSDIGDPNDTIR